MRTKAIIIKKTPASEHDQMVTLYSEDFGTMRCMARGSFRATSLQSMHLENLNLIDFEVIHGRAWPIISSAMLLEPHGNIRNSLPKLAAAQFFTEVLDKITFENEKDTQLWEFLHTMLAEFNGAEEKNILATFRKYQAQFLKVLGYAPQVDRCVVCSLDALSGPEPMVALSTELGGVMCPNCFLAGGKGIMFDKSDLGLLTGSNPSTGPTFSALDTFFEYTVGRKISSLSFFYSVLQ
jgi:DNA repair protein RecO (recombination protein O)